MAAAGPADTDGPQIKYFNAFDISNNPKWQGYFEYITRRRRRKEPIVEDDEFGPVFCPQFLRLCSWVRFDATMFKIYSKRDPEKWMYVLEDRVPEETLTKSFLDAVGRSMAKCSPKCTDLQRLWLKHAFHYKADVLNHGTIHSINCGSIATTYAHMCTTPDSYYSIYGEDGVQVALDDFLQRMGQGSIVFLGIRWLIVDEAKFFVDPCLLRVKPGDMWRYVPYNYEESVRIDEFPSKAYREKDRTEILVLGAQLVKESEVRRPKKGGPLVRRMHDNPWGKAANCAESNFRGAFVPHHRLDLHAIDATRWRGVGLYAVDATLAQRCGRARDSLVDFRRKESGFVLGLPTLMRVSGLDERAARRLLKEKNDDVLLALGRALGEDVDSDPRAKPDPRPRSSTCTLPCPKCTGRDIKINYRGVARTPYLTIRKAGPKAKGRWRSNQYYKCDTCGWIKLVEDWDWKKAASGEPRRGRSCAGRLADQLREALRRSAQDERRAEEERLKEVIRASVDENRRADQERLMEAIRRSKQEKEEKEAHDMAAAKKRSLQHQGSSVSGVDADPLFEGFQLSRRRIRDGWGVDNQYVGRFGTRHGLPVKVVGYRPADENLNRSEFWLLWYGCEVELELEIVDWEDLEGSLHAAAAAAIRPAPPAPGAGAPAAVPGDGSKDGGSINADGAASGGGHDDAFRAALEDVYRSKPRSKIVIANRGMSCAQFGRRLEELCAQHDGCTAEEVKLLLSLILSEEEIQKFVDPRADTATYGADAA